jgi:hypothetical protein
VKWIVLVAASLPALAQSMPGLETAPSRPPNLTLKLGGLVDSAEGRDLHGRLSWSPSGSLTLFLSGVRSNLASTVQAPSPDGSTTTTTTTSLGGDQSFGMFDLGLRYDQTDMSNLLTYKRFAIQPAFDVGDWRLGFELSTRTTEFDRLHFTSRPISTPTGTVYVTGYADLRVTDTGLGANVDYLGEVWRSYASYTHYDYGSLHGETDVGRIRNSAGGVSPDVFRALSGRLVSWLERISASRVGGKASLLDWTATAGLEADLKRTRWGLEATRDVDHMAGESSDTLTGTAGWKVNSRFLLELQLGATRSETFGTDRFAGLTFTLRTRPGF